MSSTPMVISPGAKLISMGISDIILQTFPNFLYCTMDNVPLI
jgi:hypothetical protein